MELFLGIDIGTGGARAGVFDRNGNSVVFCEEPFPLSTPHSGWAEQNPADWWEAVGKATRKALEVSGVSPNEIAGISFDTTSCTMEAKSGTRAQVGVDGGICPANAKQLADAGTDLLICGSALFNGNIPENAKRILIFFG